MDKDELRELQISLRGYWNGLRLCASALPKCTTREDQLEMIDGIILSADGLAASVELSLLRLEAD